MTKVPYTIVMADDDEDDCLLAQDAMQAAGSEYSCYTVGDGQELLNYLRNEGEYKDRQTRHLPSVILLDLNMPILDGRETLKRLKHDPILRKIPVVILSTSGNDADVEDGYKLGASSYMVKPNDFQSMVNIMKSFNHYWFDCATVPIISNNEILQ